MNTDSIIASLEAQEYLGHTIPSNLKDLKHQLDTVKCPIVLAYLRAIFVMHQFLSDSSSFSSSTDEAATIAAAKPVASFELARKVFFSFENRYNETEQWSPKIVREFYSKCEDLFEQKRPIVINDVVHAEVPLSDLERDILTSFYLQEIRVMCTSLFQTAYPDLSKEDFWSRVSVSIFEFIDNDELFQLITPLATLY